MQVDYSDVGRFIQMNQVGAVLGVVTVVALNGFVVKNSGVWFVLPLLVFLVLCLGAAAKSLHSGGLIRSLAFVATGNWTIAIGVSVLLPFLWPIMALTVIMPLVLASPHLSGRRVIQAIIAASVVAGVVAAIGLINDDGGVIEDIDDTFELALVVGSLAAQIVPIGLIAWLHSERQRGNLMDLTTLNSELRASEADLAASRDRVVQASDAERRRIERDLHDGAQQRLVSMGVRLRLLESQGRHDDEVQEGLTTVLADLDHAIQEVRELAHGIYPPLLQTRGLTAALAAVVRRSPLDLNAAIGDIPRLNESTETALYFVTLEALSNAAKYAPDATIGVHLSADDTSVTLTISDDGPGFDTAATPPSHGLNNMHDRLAVAGGSLEIRSEPHAGTVVQAQVPIGDC